MSPPKILPARRSSAATAVLWSAFFLGLAIRLHFLFANLKEPLLWTPIVDALEYHRWAVGILRGAGLVEGVPFHGPVYPLFLAAIYGVCGPYPWVVYVVQAFLGGAVCVLCARLALQASESAWAAGAAALAAASAWPMIYPTGYLLPYVLEMALVAGALAVLGIRRVAEVRAAALAAAAGLLMGLACHSRPQLFLSAAVLAVALAAGIAGADPGNASRASAPRAAAAFFASILGVTLAWSVLVASRTGTPVLVEGRNHGFSLYYANRPGATGQAVLFPGYDYNRILSEAERNGTNGPRGQDAYYYKAVLSWIESEPAAFLRLCARKLALSISGMEIRTGEAEPWTATDAFDRLSRFGFGPLFAFGLTGLAAGALAGGRLYRLHLLFFFSGVAYLIVAGVASRYRAPLLPSLAAGAGGLFALLQKWHRGKRWGATAAALAVAAGLWCLSEWAGALVMFQPERDLAVARALAALGWNRDLEAAQAGLERQLAVRPGDGDMRIYRGKLQVRRADWAEAENSFLELSGRFGGELPYLYSDLAAIRSVRGDFRGAREAALRARALDGRSLEDCLSAALFGLMARPPLDRPDAVYRCPLEASRHRPAFPPVEKLAEALSSGRIPDRDLVAALRPVRAWTLTRLLK